MALDMGFKVTFFHWWLRRIWKSSLKLHVLIKSQKLFNDDREQCSIYCQYLFLTSKCWWKCSSDYLTVTCFLLVKQLCTKLRNVAIISILYICIKVKWNFQDFFCGMYTCRLLIVIFHHERASGLTKSMTTTKSFGWE